MKRGIITALAVLAGWWGGANFAAAQVFGPGMGASPFYPLGGGAMRSHPFGPIQMQPVNPQIAELQQSISRINVDGSLRSPLDPTGLNALGGLQTGHPAVFFNTGHYYPAKSPGGAGASGTGFSSGIGNQGVGTGVGGYNTGIGGYNPGFSGGTLGRILRRRRTLRAFRAMAAHSNQSSARAAPLRFGAVSTRKRGDFQN